MKKILTDKAPTPVGHYSQAVIHKGIIYISGQLAVKPGSGDKVMASVEDQTEQALANIAAILEASGSDLEHVLKTTVYISDIDLWPRVNAVYAEFFGEHQPARSVVPCQALHFGFQVEIEAMAAVIDA